MPLAAALAELGDAQRRALLERVHPLYTAFTHAWRILFDALEGTGGFLSGEYLWKYPREEDKDFIARQEQARYHNYAKTLVNIYVRYAFHGGVTRTTADRDLDVWWNDVDGAGTKINDFMKRVTRIALAISHAGILIDKEAGAPTGPTRAEDTARVLALVQTPLSILDWRTARNGMTLTYAKFREAVAADPVGPSDLEAEDDEAFSYLLWDDTEWARYDALGTEVDRDTHDLGRVPLVMLRPEPSSQYPFLGQPLFGNANVLRAIYNRCSEEDEVLRNSSFSMLGVSVSDTAGPEGVARAKTDLGQDIGTTRAIVVQGAIDYKTPDQTVPGAIRDNIAFLIQEVYRMAHVFYQRDTRDTETAEAIKLKHNELQEMLLGVVEENERAEREMAYLFFLWREPNDAAAKTRFEAAQVQVQYPREFFVSDMAADLDKWAKGIALDLGKTMTTVLKKQAARSLAPALDAATRKTIDSEIDAQPAQQDVVPYPVGAGAGDRGGPGRRAIAAP